MTQRRTSMKKLDGIVVAYSITALIYMCGVGLRIIYLPILSRGSTASLGIYTASLAVGGIVGGILATRLRGNHEVIYLLASVCEGLCWLILLSPAPMAIEITILVIAGIFESSATAVFLTAIQFRLRPESIGPYYGWLIPSNDAFIFVGIVLGGIAGTTADGAVILPLFIAVFSAVPVLALWKTFVRPLFVRTTPRATNSSQSDVEHHHDDTVLGHST